MARTLRDQAKEIVLRHITWRFHAEKPLPMPKLELLECIKACLQMPRKPPLDFEGALPIPSELLDEFLQDGVLVAKGRETYGFVLRSLHEFALAG